MPTPTSDAVGDSGPRWLEADLIGEVDDQGRFERGADLTPAIGDFAHFATSDLLGAVYGSAGGSLLEVGFLSSMPSTPVSLDLAKLVARHVGVFGASGSGKTNFVAHLVQRIAASENKHAHIVVIDTQGEYADALDAQATVLRPNVDGGFEIPAWAFPCRQLLATLIGREPSDIEADGFADVVVELRRAHAEESDWLNIDSSAINPDTPIPYDLKAAWFEFDRRNHAVYEDRNDQGAEMFATRGSPADLMPSQHDQYGAGSAAPFKGSRHGAFRDAPRRMRARMRDPRFHFLLPLADWPHVSEDPLAGYLARWASRASGVVVLDLQALTAEATQIAVSAVLDFSLELAVRSRELPNADAHPLLLVIEEAHRYFEVGSQSSDTRRALERVAREGRKYGVGLALVSQRPSDIAATVLAQLGTFMGFRLTNSSDVAAVTAALPDAVGNIASSLSTLRTGEVVMSGEAVGVPSRVRMPRPTPEPRSGDAATARWQTEPSAGSLVEALALVRQYR